MIEKVVDKDFDYFNMKGKDFTQVQFENDDFSHSDLAGTNFYIASFVTVILPMLIFLM
ncbi:hypothetical protein [Companilactobacillus furfuricola]|uniref:hypothetical protein n=1 Tax=Companilactobacillus furfuricola TaxID=1462575 RepID=UPI001FE5CDA3|nr:hypothetical protein [Companilactobacillus furfuricola]